MPGDRCYACSYCDKAYTDDANLRRHIRGKHPETKLAVIKGLKAMAQDGSTSYFKPFHLDVAGMIDELDGKALGTQIPYTKDQYLNAMELIMGGDYLKLFRYVYTGQIVWIPSTDGEPGTLKYNIDPDDPTRFCSCKATDRHIMHLIWRCVTGVLGLLNSQVMVMSQQHSDDDNDAIVHANQQVLAKFTSIMNAFDSAKRHVLEQVKQDFNKNPYYAPGGSFACKVMSFTKK